MVNIECVIKKTIKTYKTNDAFTICKCMGIKIYVLSLGKNLESHYLYKDGIGVLFINKCLSEDRKNFLCAHQLGHLILHNKLGNYSVLQDKEANQFAETFFKLCEIYKQMQVQQVH